MLKLRRSGVCLVCASALPSGALAWWDAEKRTVTCAACLDTTAGPVNPETTRLELDRGRPDASVAREYDRRKRNREARARKARPWIGGLLLMLRGAPQHEEAFRRGEVGEKAVAAVLERRTADGPTVVLHDRRMPGGRGNIDHLAVAPAGVFVIDAKAIKGKVRVAGSLFGEAKLVIEGRDRSKLIDGLDRQVSAVRDALAAGGHADVPVHGVLCFTTADPPLLGTRTMRGHRLLHRRALARRLNANGPVQPSTIDALACTLATALPPA
jgi:hypothetical protein